MSVENKPQYTSVVFCCLDNTFQLLSIASHQVTSRGSCNYSRTNFKGKNFQSQGFLLRTFHAMQAFGPALMYDRLQHRLTDAFRIDVAPNSK